MRVYGDLTIVYPKPYSIYLRGTTSFSRVSGEAFGFGRKEDFDAILERTAKSARAVASCLRPYAAFQLLLLTILLLRGLCTEGPKASPKTPVFRIWAKLPALPAEEVASEVPQFLVHEITCKNMKAVIERTGPCVGAKMGACPRLGSCCICMDDADMVAMLPCGHTFCEPCIAQWSMSGSEYSGKCPVCRADFGAAALDG